MKMNYDFDTAVNRRGTNSSKWDGMRLFNRDIRFDDDTIPMFLADMDFYCSPAIQEAMKKVAERGIWGYSTHLTDPRYLDSIVDWYKRRYGVILEKEWIIYSDGSVAAINSALNAFLNPGDGVIINPPVYGHFNGMITAETPHAVVHSSLVNDGEGYYTMDWDDFEMKCSDPLNRAFILCSPGNPVGRVWSREELSKMADICRRNHVLLISDEIHSDIVRKGIQFTSILSVTDDLSNVILINGLNKSFNVAGLKVAHAIIPDPSLRGIFMKQFGHRSPNPFSAAVVRAAYDESEEWLEALNEYLDANLTYAVNFLHEKMPKVKVVYPEGTYMLWLDFRAYGMSDQEIHRRIYDDANVILQDGKGHDPVSGDCFQRMCVTLPQSQLKEALQRIAEVFA